MATDQEAKRAIRATGPRPDAATLRRAYLDVLKLALCDLAGAYTISVFQTYESSEPYSKRLTDEERTDLRTVGRDWPLHALTMVGLRRLDDLQACVESVVADGVEGDLIEAGAWRGGSGILARATLDSLGDGRRLCVADSFEGFPLPDPDAYPEDADLDLSMLDFLSVSLEMARGHFERFGCGEGVDFLPGFFNETLPGLTDRKWSIVRLDGDTYESTTLALEALYPRLSQGGYLIVDDYGFVEVCRQAVEDFRARNEIADPIEQVDWCCVRWQRTQDPGRSAGTQPGRGARSPRRVPGRKAEPRESHIPSLEELLLSREMEGLQARFEAARAEITRLGGTVPPPPGPPA